MSLDIGEALSEGFDRTFSRNGLVLIGVFVIFGFVNTVVQQSYNLVQYEQFDPAPFFSEFEGIPFEQAEIQEFMDQAMQQASTLAYLDGLSLPVLFALTLVFAFVAEAIRIVAVRTFVSEETASIPGSLVRRNIAWATVNGVIGGLVVLILIVIGLILLVLPGLFLAVTLYFVRQEIAVEDKNFVDAMTDSWRLTKGSRFQVFALAAILVILGFGVSIVADIFLVMGATVASIASIVLLAVVGTFSIASVARAYEQLRAERTQTDELDPYLDEDLDSI